MSGSGGAFLHPTHVFSYARFRPVHDPAAGPVLLRAGAGAPGASGTASGDPARPNGSTGGGGGGGAMRRRTPSSSSLYSVSHQQEAEEAAAATGPLGGEYRCARAFPTPEQVRAGFLLKRNGGGAFLGALEGVF